MAITGFFKPPRDTLEENERLDEKGVNYANKRELFTGSLFVDKLGLDVTKVGETVPASESGVPRVFLLKDGKISTLEENNIKVGTKEFWEASLKGQMFAYPAGEKHPVQINAKTVKGMPQLTVSEPLDPEKLPYISAGSREVLPDKPRWYHRLFRFGANRRRCEAYDEAVRRDNEFVEKEKRLVEAQKSAAQTIYKTFGKLRIADFTAEEPWEKERTVEKYREARELEFAKHKLFETRKGLDASKKGVENMMTFYGPTPEKRKEWIKTDAKNAKGAIYTEEEFKELKPVKTDPSTVQIGGKGVSDLEFASLALFGACDPKIGVKAQEVTSPTAPLIKCYKKAGFTETEAETIVTGSISEIYGRSVMTNPPRADGGVYFKSAIQPGREKAEEALQEYQKGNKKPLAEILARTVSHAGQMAYKSAKMSSDFFAFEKVAGAAVGLMERDGELKQLTRQVYEEDEQRFQAKHPDIPRYPAFDEQVKSIAQAQKLEQCGADAAKSTSALLEARINNTELSEAEKKTHIKTIMKESLLSDQYKNAITLMESSGENPYNSAHKKVMQMATSLPKIKMDEAQNGFGSAGGSSLPANAPTVFVSGFIDRGYSKPEVLKTLDDKEAMDKLDRQLDKLIEKEGLAKLSTRKLSDELCTSVSRDNPIMGKLAERLLTVDQPEKKEPEKREPEKKNEEIVL